MKRIYAGYSDDALAAAISDYVEYVAQERATLCDLREALRLLREEAKCRRSEKARAKREVA